jgi:hypothetical protein
LSKFLNIASNQILKYILIIGLSVVLGVFVALGKFAAIIGLLVLVGGLFYIVFSFRNPVIPLKTVLIFGFFVIGITRYIDGPFGLAVDFLLVFCWIVTILTGWKSLNWNNTHTFVVYFFVIWFTYIVLQLLNPLSTGAEPWFYAMRGMALYPFLLLPLVFLLMNKQEDMMWMIKLWLVISILAAIKGFIQKYGDCDPFEKRWLAQGGYVTHVLFGQLRAFSFYSDAGQFGSAMGHISISCFVFFTGPYSNKKKLIFFTLFIFFFWGYLISGTRGAIAVPAAGMMMYLLLSKNFKILIFGTVLTLSFYYLMAFTLIGQGTYEIRRLRTAFTEGSEDASMIVRTENKKKLAIYLADKPFGGGVASAGDWGKRFRPDSILANIATDSFYVRIWSETGIVGLLLFLSFFFYFIFKGAWIIWFLKEPVLRNKLMALYCGVIGIMAASYGNSVFSQFPTNIICYTSICFILIAEKRWIKKDVLSQNSLFLSKK